MKTDTFTLNRKQRHLLIDALSDSIKAEEARLQDLEYDLADYTSNGGEIRYNDADYSLSSFKAIVTRFRNEINKDKLLLDSIKE